MPAAWLLAVILIAPSATTRLRAFSGAVLVLSWVEPAVALLLVAALAPLSAIWAVEPDTIVLAFLIGWLAQRRDARAGPRVPPLVCACALLLACDYLIAARAAPVGALRTIGGMGLAVAAIELFRRRPALAVQLPIAIVAGAGISAIFAPVHVAGISVMIACVAAGIAIRERGRLRAAWGIAGAMALIGVSSPGYPVQNTYERIAEEAGRAGAALFIVFLAAVLWIAGQGVAASPRDARLLGCTAGIVVFLAACIAGDPLRMPHAAVPFWLLLGLTMALAGSSVLREREASLDAQDGRDASSDVNVPAR